MKKFLPVLVLTMLINLLQPHQAYSAAGEYRVVKITDGDTFLATDGVLHFKVRMIGIDAPESYQDLGKIAKFKLGELIENQIIRLEPLQHSHGLDKYGRVLAKVFVNNTDVAEQLIRNGYAFYYRPYCTDYPNHKKSYQYDPVPYVNAEQSARSMKIGVLERQIGVAMPGTKKSPSLMPRLIGITGGIATGKSTVTAYLRSKRIPVICADEISHQLTRKNAAGWKAIRRIFGKGVFLNTGELDRTRLANFVFNDASAKLQLEKILHPLVRIEMLNQIKRVVKNKKNKLIFLDVPLLFESGLDAFCDATICVSSNQKIQIERLKKYRNMTRTQALARIHSQMALRLKIQKSNCVIRNTGTKKQLFVKIDQILQNFNNAPVPS